MGDPIKMETHGGLRYNANEAKPSITKDGKFQLIFKSGTLTYPQQNYSGYQDANGRPVPGHVINAFSENLSKHGIYPDNKKPEVREKSHGGLLVETTELNMANIMGATFTSSTDTQVKVKLTDGSTDNYIDLAANDSKVFGDSAFIDGGSGNTVKLDNQDFANVDGQIIDSKGEHKQPDMPNTPNSRD